MLWKSECTDLLNKFKLVIFCFIAVFRFSFYIEMTVIVVTFGGCLLKPAVMGTLTVQYNWNFALFCNMLCELCCDDKIPIVIMKMFLLMRFPDLLLLVLTVQGC